MSEDARSQQTPLAAAKSPLEILLAAPRGFCAGVDRAIKIVELALEKFGAPVYVRHEIVHNRFVVDSLRAKGAVFVEELDEIPDTDRPVIFSAHGVAKSVPAAAKARNMFVLDATCPLVFKVHFEAVRHHQAGHQVLLIGHAGHPEVIGTMGQLPEGAVELIETVEDAESFKPRDGQTSRSPPRPLFRLTTPPRSSPPSKGVFRRSLAHIRKTSATRQPTVRPPSRRSPAVATSFWWSVRPTAPIRYASSRSPSGQAARRAISYRVPRTFRGRQFRPRAAPSA